MSTFSPVSGARMGCIAVACLLLCGLSGCAGTDPLAGLAPPPSPSVPQVAEEFPSVGVAPPNERNPPLSPEAQQKLQKDLERSARRQGANPQPQAQ